MNFRRAGSGSRDRAAGDRGGARRPLRVAWSAAPLMDAPVDPEIAATVRRTAETLAGAHRRSMLIVIDGIESRSLARLESGNGTKPKSHAAARSSGAEGKADSLRSIVNAGC